MLSEGLEALDGPQRMNACSSVPDKQKEGGRLVRWLPLSLNCKNVANNSVVIVGGCLPIWPCMKLVGCPVCVALTLRLAIEN